MDNAAVAQVFAEIAEMLALKGENPFKIRAYSRASETLAGLAEPLEQTLAQGKLRAIPGVGEAIAAKIEELLTTGHLRYHEKLRAELPHGAPEQAQFPGEQG